ncbi:Bestrophin, RFP-TM, chloride channel-domain-containing protein [Mycena floridula]|nr:Bestrophin, RFP-TM, chloride channel-domain-containing protein [Mycena floridula]
MAGKDRLISKRSFTGNHPLLPSIRPPPVFTEANLQQPAYSLLSWTFGRGSVIWRTWPAVLLHTAFAAGIVTLRKTYKFEGLGIPPVLLTVLGVVIGFVISYRAMSGYDRYWMGRTTWSDVIRNSRTLGRLIWFHTPPRLTPKTSKETELNQVIRPTQELVKVMAEKRMALDLVEAFAVALKHHVRGEVGIYYEDLYDLVRPLHDHDHTVSQKAAAMTTAMPAPSRAHRIASNPSLPKATDDGSTTFTRKAAQFFGDHSTTPPPPSTAYGTFEGGSNGLSKSPSGSLRHQARRPSQSSDHSTHQTLQPAQKTGDNTVMEQVSPELIPFAGVFASVRNWFRGKDGYTQIDQKNPFVPGASARKWTPPLQPRIGSAKHRRIATANGENLPVEILRCLSEWFSVLEDRNTVPGTSLGSMIGTIAAMEETLTTLEKILSTPLPFGYAVHIRHTVWIYLFFLPFQLVDQFEWYTIGGVAVAAFIYLGFLAAGEEIEQPFGYDENDLDLDMFCQEIIHVDIQNLKKSPCLNAYLPPAQKQITRQYSMSLTEATAQGSDSEAE